jgi:hypothetical protein
MRAFLAMLPLLLSTGCESFVSARASHAPLPSMWGAVMFTENGDTAEDVIAKIGHPTRRVHEDGKEVWIYERERDVERRIAANVGYVVFEKGAVVHQYFTATFGETP